jgi:hypothetical protein
MTPKEKAEELVNRYKNINYDLDDVENHKECALIALDEIIDVLSKDINPLVNYWFEVKQEIEKL